MNAEKVGRGQIIEVWTVGPVVARLKWKSSAAPVIYDIHTQCMQDAREGREQGKRRSRDYSSVELASSSAFLS